MVAFFFSYSLL
uniref:Uncharacterized protein n=1 Tax=Rhizophora mucronata TaxID=61149 RepID=A0A2P2PBV7_RHIMU